MPMAIATEPWQQPEGESPQAYAAFVAHRDPGPSRSLDRAREIVSPPGGSTGAQGGAQAGRDGPRPRVGEPMGLVRQAHAWGARMDRVRQEAAERAEAEDAEDLVRARRA
jgi:hypothetical protein